jgi:hypothetical protein
MDLPTYVVYESGSYTEVPAKSVESRNKLIRKLRDTYENIREYQVVYKSINKLNYIPIFRGYRNPFVKELEDELNESEIIDKITNHFYCYYFTIYDHVKLHNDVNNMLCKPFVFRTELYNKMYSFLFKTSIITDSYIHNAPIYIFDLRLVAQATELDMTYMDKFERCFNITYPITNKISQLIHDSILHVYRHLYGNYRVVNRLKWLMENKRIDIPRLFIFSYIYSNIFMLWATCDDDDGSMLYDTQLQTLLQI